MSTTSVPAETNWIVELTGQASVPGMSNNRTVRASYVSYATAHGGLVELKDANHKVVFTAPLSQVCCVRRFAPDRAAAASSLKP